VATAPPRTDPRVAIGFAGLIAAVALNALVLAVRGGWPPGFLAALILLPLAGLPILCLPWLAYAGERHRIARLIVVVMWVVIVGAFGFLTVNTVIGSLADRSVLDAGGKAIDALPIGAGAKILRACLGVIAGMGLGLACFSRSVREAAAARLPLSPNSFVHATALASVVALTVISLVPLAVLHEPPALQGLTTPDTAADGDGASHGVKGMKDFTDDQILRLLVYQFGWTLIGCAVAVGFPLWRDFGATLERLGLVWPGWRGVGVGVGVAALLVPGIMGIEATIHWLWGLLGWPQTSEQGTDQLFRFAFSPVGAAVVGVTAGVGEELAVRGVLQPRLGILLPNLFFASLHALQYNFDGVIGVFVIGLVLGLVRRATNTTTSAIVHGLYDSTLVLLSWYAQFAPGQAGTS
jgi:hypothetical protein